MQPTPEQQKTIEAEILTGNMIAAIKLHRQFTAAGLRESKEWVEAREAELRAKSPERFTAPAKSGGCLGLVVFGVLCGTLLLSQLA